MFDREPRFSREAILAAMTAADLVRPLAMICRARDDNAIYYDLVAGDSGNRQRRRVPVSASEAEFQAAIDALAALKTQ